MKFKKYVCLLPALILFAATLFGCNNNTTDTEETSSSLTEEKSQFLTIASNGESEYTVWHETELLLSYDVMNQINSIRSTLKSKAGVDIAVKKDSVYTDSDAEKPAILIGDTVFEESRLMQDLELKLGDYYVGTVGNKIIIYSNTEDGYVNAIRYFVNKVIATQGGEDSSVCFTDDHTVTHRVSYGINSIKCGGVELSDFSIVISKNADVNESLFANELRQYLIKNYGYDLPIVNDSEPKQSNELLIGNARSSVTAQDGKYRITEENGALRFFADGMLGYNELLVYIQDTLWKPSGAADYTVDIGFSLLSDISPSIDDATLLNSQKYGDIRCMFYNVYGYEEDAGPISLRQNMQAEIIKTYAPDVVAFQEYAPAYHLSFTPKITELGYTQVEVSLGSTAKNNWTPLFYNAEKLEIVDKGYLLYSGTNNENSKSVTWAVFTDKATGKQLLVMGTHFMWNQPDVEDPDALRVQNATELVAKINEIKATYENIPLAVGGDLNCGMESAPARVLTDAGLSHAWETAENKNNSTGHHGYSTYDSEKKIYTKYYTPSEGAPYIDHVYVSDNVSVGAFATAIDKYSLICSDHSPIIVDIST